MATADIVRIARPDRIFEDRFQKSDHPCFGAIIVQQPLAKLIFGYEAAAADRGKPVDRQAEAGIRGELQEIGAAHRVADEMSLFERHDLDEAFEMRKHAGALAHEVMDLGRLAKTEPVGRDYAKMPCQARYQILPAKLRAGAEFPAVQQYQRVTFSRFQIVRPH